MNDIEIFLAIIVIFTAASFVLSFMRLWFVTNYDADLGNKVKGLRMSFAKLTKDVKAQYKQSSNDLKEMEVEEAKLQLDDLSSLDLSNMTLEQAAESIGIDAEQLNSPLIRPMAEKIFQQIKDKAKGGNESVKEGY
jgi:hypothetical protein